MLQQGDVMMFLNDTGHERETMLSVWLKRWNPWGDHGALELHCSSSETYYRFILCRKEADYEKQLASVLAWMRKQGELPSRASSKYLALSVPADGLWFVHCHDYWCWDCDLELP